MGVMSEAWDSTVKAIAAVQADPDSYPSCFDSWLLENRAIWLAFEREAKSIAARGFSHYSARTIVHVLRHHSALTEADGEWKINNNHSPYLGRVFEAVHPELAGFFERRSTMYERRALMTPAEIGAMA